MATRSELETALESLRSADGAPEASLAALEQLGDRMRDQLDELDVDEEAQEALWQRYGEIQAHLEGVQILRGPDPVNGAVTASRPDLVARIGTDAAFACALEQSAEHVAKPYYATKSGLIYAVASLATTEPRRVRAIAALASHIEAMVKARLAGGDLVNAVAFVACARALARLRPIEAREIVTRRSRPAAPSPSASQRPKPGATRPPSAPTSSGGIRCTRARATSWRRTTPCGSSRRMPPDLAPTSTMRAARPAMPSRPRRWPT